MTAHLGRGSNLWERETVCEASFHQAEAAPQEERDAQEDQLLWEQGWKVRAPPQVQRVGGLQKENQKIYKFLRGWESGASC